MAHTPGPWRAEIRRTDCWPWWHINTATVHGEIIVNTSEDDARLIAAAPELLSELKSLLSMWEEAIGWEPNYMDMADSARKVIAKAEGRNP